jgi:hypothetical protein
VSLVLGKTAAKLLLLASRDGGSVITEVVHPPRGRPSYGLREYNAAVAARDAGLLELVGHEKIENYNRGWRTTISATRWRITDAGRAALAGRAP